MKQLRTFVALVAVASLFAVPALACEGHGKMAKLGLSEDQQKQLGALKTDMENKAAPVREQLQTLRTELKDLWSKDNPDRNAIIAKMAEMDAYRQQLRELKVDFKLSAAKILTSEQRAKFMEFGMGHGRKGGMGGECGCMGDGPHGHGPMEGDCPFSKK